MSYEELDESFQSAIQTIQDAWKEGKKKYEEGTEGLTKEIGQLKIENEKLQEKYEDAQAKIDKIEGQLSKTVEQMESMSKATEKGIDAMQLLDVYLVLMENVFESQVHTRLLIILHGAKEKYTLSEIGKAAGISGIQIRQAVFDLRNAGLVNYNEETEEIELEVRFME